MHTFDILFGIVAIVFIVLGIRRGFIEEVMRLIAIVAGFACALLFYRHGISKIAFLSLAPQVAGVVSFLLIFLGCMVAIILIGKIIKKLFSLTMLGWLDRMCGGCLGGVKAFFLGWVFVIAVSSLPVSGASHFFEGSRSYSFFKAISPSLKAEVLKRAKIRPANPSRATGPLSAIGDVWKKLTSPQKKEKDTSSHRKPVQKTSPGIDGDSI